MSKKKPNLEEAYQRLGISQTSSDREVNEVYAEKKAVLFNAHSMVKGTAEQADILAQVTQLNAAYNIIDQSKRGALSATAQQEQVQTAVVALKSVVRTVAKSFDTTKIDVNKDYYQILDLKPEETLAQRMSKAVLEGKTEVIQAINILGNPEKKLYYDTERTKLAKSAEKPTEVAATKKSRFPLGRKVINYLTDANSKENLISSAPKVSTGGKEAGTQR